MQLCFLVYMCMYILYIYIYMVENRDNKVKNVKPGKLFLLEVWATPKV